jgi:MFS family permease
MEASESQLSYPGWRVTIASFFGVMAGFGSILIYSFGIFLKPLQAEFGWPRETLGTAFACASFTLGLCSPPLGHLVDRYGPKRVILACVTVFGCALGSLAFLTPHRAHLFAVFVVIGAVGNGTAQMGYARAVSTWFHRHRGLALGVMMAGSAGGAILVPVICQSLISAYGWRVTYAILGMVALTVGLPLAGFFVYERPGTRDVRGKATQTGAGVPEALRHRAFWIIAATLFLAAMSTTGTVTHLAALLNDRGISPRQASYALSALGAASLCGRLATGWMLDRFFGARVGMALLFLNALALWMLATAKTASAGIAAAALMGFSMGGESDVTPYLLARYFGLRSLATLYGFTWTAYAISAAVGSILLGRAFDQTGSYQSLLVELSALMLLAGVFMAALPRYGATSTDRLPEPDRVGQADTANVPTVP